VRVHGLAVTDCEHVVCGFAGDGLFQAGPLSPRLEDIDGCLSEVDTAPAVRCLAARFVEVVANSDEASVDRHRVLVEVDVAPFEAEEFAATHPGVGREPERREQATPDRSSQERCQLLGCPGLGFVFGYRPEPRCVRDERDVAGLNPALFGVIEGAADDEMNLEHRVGCQCLRICVGGSELRVVQGFRVGDFSLRIGTAPSVGRMWRSILRR